MHGRTTPVSSALPAQRFDLLDAIRGLAALMVVQRHTTGLFSSGELPSSYLAVDVFFTMSGVVIAHAYQARLTGGMGIFAFMKARLLRLYPIYLLGTALVVAALLVYPQETRADSPAIVLAIGVLINLAFLPVPPTLSLNTVGAYVDNPAWSLFDELVVNAVFAALVRWLNIPLLMAIVAASALALVMTSLSYGSLDVGYTWDALGAGLPRAFYGFFAGVLIERVYHRLPVFGARTGAACLLGILLVMVAGVPGGRWFYDPLVALFALPTLVLISTRVRLSDEMSKVCAVLGAISYPIYTLHFGLYVAVSGLAPQLTGMAPTDIVPLAGYIYLLALIGLSLAAHYWFDAPVRQFLARKLSGASNRPLAPAPRPF